MEKSKESEVIGYLEHVVNSFSSLKRDMVKFEFGRVHKTLQQSIVRTIIVPILERLAEDYEKGCYDDRNEASARFAKQIKDSGVLDSGFPFI